MSGYDLKLNAKDATKALQHLEAAGGDLSKPMRHIAQKLLNSVKKNFRDGGRYSRADSIIGGATKWADAKHPPSKGSTLYRSGHLQRSIQPVSDTDTASLSTNVEYAAIQNFGAYARSILFVHNRDKTTNRFTAGTTPGRGHTFGEHPARPFMVIQDEDIEDAKTILRGHLLGIK